MKKVIENLKRINKFGLVLILIAVGIIYTQSAFKASKLVSTTEYVLIPGTGPGTGWQPKGALEYGEEIGNYNCNESITVVCSGFFENETPPTSPSDQPLSTGKRDGQLYMIQ